MTDGGVFGGRGAQWASWQASPWGRLRYDVVAETTTRALAGMPGALRVCDVGGGDGADSLPLAARGHTVTVLDLAPALLERAARAATEAGVADRVTTVHADLDDDSDPRVAQAAFDVVLCHNVLQYRADVPATVRRLARLLRAGGALSVLAPNPAMDVLSRAVRGLDPAAARALLDAPTVHGETFDSPMRRLEAADVEDALQGAGCAVVHRFGVRCVMDLMADDAPKADPGFYRQVLDLELALCDREPYRRTARFWHLVARRGDRAG